MELSGLGEDLAVFGKEFALMRLAAVGDVHLSPEREIVMRTRLRDLDQEADALLLAGDLTNFGTREEAATVARAFGDLPVPVVAVLGNHDHEHDRPAEVAEDLRASGVTVLDGEGVVLPIGEMRLGVAGVKGFGGGFPDAHGSAFGEREMKVFMNRTAADADALKHALHGLDADRRVALMHYAPVAETLSGEPRELYPFLGSHLLGEAVDEGGASLALHGHAHNGTEHGATSSGTPVRNVAQTVLARPYAVYDIGQPATDSA